MVRGPARPRSGDLGDRRRLADGGLACLLLISYSAAALGSGDTRQQVQLRFSSCEAAEAYATKHGIDAVVHRPPPKKLKLQAYADNFR